MAAGVAGADRAEAVLDERAAKLGIRSEPLELASHLLAVGCRE
jgi:hypothetical protein